MMAPRVLAEYKVPTDLPTAANSLAATLTTTGKIAPRQRVSGTMIIDASKNLTSKTLLGSPGKSALMLKFHHGNRLNVMIPNNPERQTRNSSIANQASGSPTLSTSRAQ